MEAMKTWSEELPLSPIRMKKRVTELNLSKLNQIITEEENSSEA